MGLFSKKKRKTTTDVKFKKLAPPAERTLEDQDGKVTGCSWLQAEEYLENMFDDDDQFVILTAADARYGVRYIQACTGEGRIRVELGIEEEDHIRLVEKLCSEEECLDIFQEFYETSFVHDKESYHPVEFFA